MNSSGENAASITLAPSVGSPAGRASADRCLHAAPAHPPWFAEVPAHAIATRWVASSWRPLRRHSGAHAPSALQPIPPNFRLSWSFNLSAFGSLLVSSLACVSVVLWSLRCSMCIRCSGEALGVVHPPRTPTRTGLRVIGHLQRHAAKRAPTRMSSRQTGNGQAQTMPGQLTLFKIAGAFRRLCRHSPPA